MIKHFFMHPPKWLDRILGKFPCYRKWFIKQMWKIIVEDVRQGIKNTEGDNE